MNSEEQARFTYPTAKAVQMECTTKSANKLSRQRIVTLLADSKSTRCRPAVSCPRSIALPAVLWWLSTVSISFSAARTTRRRSSQSILCTEDIGLSKRWVLVYISLGLVTSSILLMSTASVVFHTTSVWIVCSILAAEVATIARWASLGLRAHRDAFSLRSLFMFLLWVPYSPGYYLTIRNFEIDCLALCLRRSI